jgi:hypothetical protein
MNNHRCCPTCGQPLPADREPVVTLETLRKFCVSKGYTIFVGDRILETAVANILGLASGTVRNWRSGARPLAFSRSGGGRGRPYYKLTDVLAFMQRPDPE